MGERTGSPGGRDRPLPRRRRLQNMLAGAGVCPSSGGVVRRFRPPLQWVCVNGRRVEVRWKGGLPSLTRRLVAFAIGIATLVVFVGVAEALTVVLCMLFNGHRNGAGMRGTLSK